ncbi:glycoside hydrolase family 3 C-terminal domain-containing protein, partial [Streptomyces sp. SID11385]|uniref:glycoside hydrolase family 3 C-terminal domain-containing protein n=1 Tax=Streptomyces sp. SID11385 TaxID=2706031 RepID=UPI0013CD46D6
DVVIAALGDRAGLFGRGTSGEGCDAPSLRLPGVQQELLDALLDTGTPVVGVLLAGRPYALGRAAAEAGALVQAFFPGQEGTRAIAALLSGRAAPSGRLPVSVPRTPDGQPGTYLRAPLAGPSDVSALDPSPAFPFGHGLTYTSFAWTDLTPGTPGQVPTDGTVRLALTVTNTGERAGTEVVQVYLHDPVASVVQPEQRLVGALRVPLAPGASARVHVEIPADTASFTGLAGRRVVEPGDLEFRLSASSTDHRLRCAVRLTGPVREVGHGRELGARLRVE